MLQDVGPRLRRIARIAGLGTDREERGLVAFERDVLDERLVPVLFRGRAGRDRGALGRQLLEDDVERGLGREARVDPVPGTRFENWDTDEPSDRGIDGVERMRLVRDDIAARVADLLDRLQTRSY